MFTLGRMIAVDHALIVVAANYLIFVSPFALLTNWRRRSWLRSFLATGLGVVSAVALSALLGSLWYEPRPFVAEHYTPLIPHAADASFPSDHLAALGALTAATGLSRRSAGLLVLGISLLVATARVAAGVHYPVDVIAGFALGVGCGLAGWWLVKCAMPTLDRVESWLAGHRLRPTSTQ